jgi:long-subunit fatty acid transport protein
LIAFAAISIQQSSAQKYVDESSSFTDRLYFGGNFGLQFGTFTHIEASPIAGYMINEKWSAGVGAIYQYFKIRGTSQVGDYETNIYGGKLFSRYNFSSQLFGYTEYENINLDVIFNTSNGYELGRAWVPAYFIGGGYFQPIGNRAGFTVMALYNILHNPARSPYGSPFVLRVGFTI